MRHLPEHAHRRAGARLLFLLGLAIVAYLTLMIWALGYLGDPVVRWLTGEGYKSAAQRLGLDTLPHLLSGAYLLLLAIGAAALVWLTWSACTQIGAFVLERVGRSAEMPASGAPAGPGPVERATIGAQNGTAGRSL